MSNIFWIILALLLVYFFYTIIRRYYVMKNYTPDQDSEKIIVLTDTNFTHQTSKGIVLVDFWAAWCMPCRLIAPILSELAESMDETVRIGKLNVDEHKATAEKYGIQSIPTLLLFKEGQVVEKFVGVKPKAVFEKAIKKHQHS
ncbi:MAG: thioredoxin [Bacteroidales bacterium]|nr:thioredoxin [Bacteroidales bacterium]